MLTVKIISSGVERIREAQSVFFNKPSPIAGDPPASVFIVFREGDVETVYEGLVYVMNDNGKTVADYALALPSVS